MTLIDANWDFTNDIQSIEQKDYNDFEQKIKCMSENVLHLIECNFFNKVNIDSNSASSNQGDLKVLIERNKEIKSDIDSKIEELKQRQQQYEDYKQNKKMLSQEIKDTHEAFLMAKKFYKKNLKIYYTIDGVQDEKQKIFVQFFTESRKTSDKYSVCFHRDMKTSTYELIDTVPRLSNLKDLQKKLGESKDVPAVVCCIREAFLKIKQNQ